MSRIDAAYDAGISHIERGMRVVLLPVIQGNPLLQVVAGWDELFEQLQASPQRHMRLEQESRVVGRLGQGEALLRYVPRRLSIPPYVKPPQPYQHREQLRRL